MTARAKHAKKNGNLVLKALQCITLMCISSFSSLPNVHGRRSLIQFSPSRNTYRKPALNVLHAAYSPLFVFACVSPTFTDARRLTQFSEWECMRRSLRAFDAVGTLTRLRVERTPPGTWWAHPRRRTTDFDPSANAQWRLSTTVTYQTGYPLCYSPPIAQYCTFKPVTNCKAEPLPQSPLTLL